MEKFIDDYKQGLLIESFNDGNSECRGFFEKNQIYRLIILPILTTPEETIIHEINHALADIPIARNLSTNRFIAKSGLYVNEEEENLNELINERASIEIFEIFKRRGGDLSVLHLNIYKCSYLKNLYLIDEFYNKFKRIIKESLITLDKNNLVERIGNDNYQELVNVVNKYYVDDLHLSRKNKKETKEVRQSLVDKMQKKVTRIEELTKEDLEKFYKELEEEGKEVIILNELEDNENSLHF